MPSKDTFAKNTTLKMDWDRLETVGWNPKGNREYIEALHWFRDNLWKYTQDYKMPTPLKNQLRSVVCFTRTGVSQEVTGEFIEIYKNWEDFKELAQSCCPVTHNFARVTLTPMDF